MKFVIKKILKNTKWIRLANRIGFFVGLSFSALLGAGLSTLLGLGDFIIMGCVIFSSLCLLPVLLGGWQLNLRWEKTFRSEKQLKLILQNFRHGVLILNRHGKVLPNYSEVTVSMFGQNPSGKDFSDLLRLQGAAADSVKHWIELLFSEVMSFEELKALGPKSFEKLNSKYVELSYHPIFDEDGELTKMMVIASDRTKEKRLRERALFENSQAQFVMSVIKDRKGFDLFVREAKQHIAEIKSSLERGLNDALESEEIIRHLHTLKGIALQHHAIELHRESRAIEYLLIDYRSEKNESLPSFRNLIEKRTLILANHFENFLELNAKLLGKVDDHMNGDKSLPTRKVHEVTAALCSELGEDSSAYKKFLENFVLEDFSIGLQKYSELVLKLSEYQGKEVDLEIAKSGIYVFMESYLSLVSSLIHIFRNAVDHGIESTHEREEKNKPARGKIKISFQREPLSTQNDSFFRMTIEDDGRGLDPQRILQRAIDREILNVERVSELSEHQILQLVFHHGMTTSEKVTDISGRGVGLDTVKYETLKVGGQVWSESVRGKGTSFTFILPIYQTPVFSRLDLKFKNPYETRKEDSIPEFVSKTSEKKKVS